MVIFRNKKLYIGIAIVIAFVLILWLIMGRNTKVDEKVTVKVKKGDFHINVTTTGELEARSSENIYGPQGLRSIGVWQVKISDLIPEGTVVDSGEYVATLDRTEISTKMKDVESELDKNQSQYTKTKLDTTLEMRTARDELINLKYGFEEKQIILDQSIYEPPATIRQAEIDLEKAKRSYEQAVKNYKLKYEQAKAKMQEVNASLNQQQRKSESIIDNLKQFTIKAPKAGMIIYKRDWDGKKVTTGSTISVFENIVATLPNLSKMISKTYVNEIDISKVKVDQIVEIGVDAFPDKKFTGKVLEVANIGEQLPNSDAKVFEVKIVVNEFDSILRPAMTTKNTVITSTIKNVLFIPIECIHIKDKIAFVYVSNGGKVSKQQVRTGASNENEIIITQGLKEGDEVLLTIPIGAEELTIKKL
ncbi:MAG: efflux RND transporter periplasmic adaptor subunit [Bacteroidetes bacterium]|nr:efflux RND transporter periplasmic adaptor subunit [Bacteroidota bacterium]